MKNIFAVSALLGFLMATPVYAQIGMMGAYQNGVPASNITSPAISVALQDIYKSQNASDLSKIVCSKVTNDQFEKLGDAYMGYGITEQQHTAMEQMMGGEGSVTLKQAHINMGQAYLGCWSSSDSAIGPISGMGYYGPSGLYPSGMMGWGYGPYFDTSGWLGGVTMIIVWILSVLGIIALVKWLRKLNT